ncbi:2-octaprenyl-6-methoxyphenyl hydroxylase [Cellvibrio polysaccharolyticus]|uniref:2-octaprenyl-6-methoxyphenyl hydroxylase n=1 Tax=Cellvibrio polysaccharolyticus TaxID=2082724 RepID=A0A928V3X8_9GAMM|nr:2-octaprenyl-6-methoxyphenyl hydroxylase [Cellvibrio polysaccharolyticus]MBE8716147.1 2-octaprenyl-6-methoxyphenyl hydroxylase [Cellvibrio polysaccharolyticus]
MTQAQLDVDIAIVGGGHVGGTLAALLAASRCGWRVALIEAGSLWQQAQQTTTDSAAGGDARSTALSFGTVDILRQLQLWHLLESHATPIRTIHVSDRGRFPGTRLSAEDHQVEALGYVIENHTLGRVLAGFLLAQTHITLFDATRVASVTPVAGGMCLQLQQQEKTITLTAALAVVADGGDSPLRRSLGIQVQQQDYAQTAIIANVTFTHPHQGVAWERFTDFGPMALLPLDGARGKRAALIWTLPAADAELWLNAPDADFLTALQQRFGTRAGRFTHVGRRVAFPLQLRIAQEQIRQGLVLVGNAAHFLHPVAGQGLNLAVRDCVMLTEVLKEARERQQSPGDLAVLRHYLQRQQQDQSITIDASDKLVKWFSTRHPLYVTLRHLGFLSLAGVPGLEQYFAARAMGTAGRAPRWQRMAIQEAADATDL